jgi:nucleotide-binding universal stress UspA family protein
MAGGAGRGCAAGHAASAGTNTSGAGAVFKDILFTVDLEHFASWERALPVALHEAKASGTQLHVLTVLPEVAVPALNAGRSFRL